MSEFEATQQLRRRLPNVWAAFFAAHGSLTEPQLCAMNRVLDGHNVLLSAPTASGKTEAIVAPVAQRLRAEHWQGLSVLQIVPTRALANDMLKRLEPAFTGLEISVAIRHGDRPYMPKATPSWLITTPESLDSLLCRRTSLFADVRTIILDEIHLLDGTHRGDQMRILLRRLQQVSQHTQVGTHMLSATLRSPAETASRYVDPCDIISVEGGRPIQTHYIEAIDDLIPLAQQSAWAKLLVFCNSRNAVEQTATSLPSSEHRYKVVAHHGSLSRSQREEAERVMREDRLAICVSTSTLEIGIDIGDIDAVVLAEAPFSVSSLMQRVGRGNRRTHQIQAVSVTKTADERNQLESMFSLAQNGDFQAKEYAPDPSVIVQQILSALFQNQAGMTDEELTVLLQPLASSRRTGEVTANLVHEGWIVRLRGKLRPATLLLDEAEKGKIHSNIPDDGDIRVRNVKTGQQVGRIGRPFDSTFILAGRSWKVVAVNAEQVDAVQVAGGVAPAQFGAGRSRGRWHFLLPAD